MGEFVGGEKLSELISRDQAITAMLKEHEDDVEAYGCPIPECFDGDRAVCVIAKLPTIDAVPVVRCKDCRYSNTSLVSDKIVCVYFDDAIYGMQENDFCSRGERRTDEA